MAKVSDNKDEDGLGRIRVTYTNEDEVVSNWIPYLSSLAADGSGISCPMSMTRCLLFLSMLIKQSS